MTRVRHPNGTHRTPDGALVVDEDLLNVADLLKHPAITGMTCDEELTRRLFGAVELLWDEVDQLQRGYPELQTRVEDQDRTLGEVDQERRAALAQVAQLNKEVDLAQRRAALAQVAQLNDLAAAERKVSDREERIECMGKELTRLIKVIDDHVMTVQDLASERNKAHSKIADLRGQVAACGREIMRLGDKVTRVVELRRADTLEKDLASERERIDEGPDGRVAQLNQAVAQLNELARSRGEEVEDGLAKIKQAREALRISLARANVEERRANALEADLSSERELHTRTDALSCDRGRQVVELADELQKALAQNEDLSARLDRVVGANIRLGGAEAKRKLASQDLHQAQKTRDRLITEKRMLQTTIEELQTTIEELQKAQEWIGELGLALEVARTNPVRLGDATVAAPPITCPTCAGYDPTCPVRLGDATVALPAVPSNPEQGRALVEAAQVESRRIKDEDPRPRGGRTSMPGPVPPR